MTNNTKVFYFVAHNQEAKGIAKHFECALYYDNEILFDGVNIFYDEVDSIMTFRDRIKWDFITYEHSSIWDSNFTGTCILSVRETIALLEALASVPYLKETMTEGLGLVREIVRKENLQKILAD